MIKKRDLDAMSYAQLSDLRGRVDEAMFQRQVAEKAALKAKMQALAAEAGFSMDELLGSSGRGKKKSGISVPKYCNPEDPSQTWTGRGRKPNWLVNALNDGADMEDFAI